MKSLKKEDVQFESAQSLLLVKQESFQAPHKEAPALDLRIRVAKKLGKPKTPKNPRETKITHHKLTANQMQLELVYLQNERTKVPSALNQPILPRAGPRTKLQACFDSSMRPPCISLADKPLV